MRLECLESLSTDDKTEIEGIIAGLPSGQVELLQLLNALLIKQTNDASTGGITIISSHVEAVTDAAVDDISVIVPEGATGAFITPYDSAVYFTIDPDGAVEPDVSADKGHYIPQLTTIDIKFLSNLKMIAESGTANVYFTFYK